MKPLYRSMLTAVLCRFALGALLALGMGRVAWSVEPAPVSTPAEGADEWAAKARDAQKKGSVFEALDAFDQAVKADPTRSDIRLDYADLLRTAGFWLRSASQYKSVLERRPDSIDCRLGYAELLMAEYQVSAAAEQFSSVLKLTASPLDKEHAMVGLGTAQFAQDDFASAARTFSGVLATQPDSASAIAYLALSKRRLGDLDESLRLWTRFLELQPDAARAKIHRIEIEELRAAIDQARLGVQANPSNDAAWAGLGKMLRKKPDLPGAEEAYKAAVKLAPGTAAYRFLLGAVQRDEGHWNDAAGNFAGVGPDPTYGALAWYNLAYCARRAKDREAERLGWAGAVKLNARDMYAYRRFVEAARAGNDLEVERTRARLAAKQAEPTSSGGDPLPFVRLAIVEQVAGDLDAARRATLEALRVDPNDVHAQKLLRDLLVLDNAAITQAMKELEASAGGGVGGTAAGKARSRAALLIVLNRESEAMVELNKLLLESPRDARLMVALAYCLKSAGKTDEAIAMLQSARQADPEYLYAHLDLGLLYLEAKRSEDAITTARAAVRLAPDDPLGYSLLGSTLKERGELEKSAAALERAVSIDPLDDEGAPRLLLARVYGAMGRNEDAREALKGDLPEEPSEIYALAWKFVRDTYLDRTYRGQDWRKWEHRFDGKLRTTPEALGAVALMLSSLDDRNTRLRSPDQTAILLFTQRTDVPEFSRSGAALSTSKTVEAHQLGENVGYIAITNLDDPKLPGEIQKAVEQMKNSDGVILDLRGNQGGGDGDVPRIAGMFVQPGTPTGTVVEPGRITRSKAEAPTPDGKPILPADKPVVVLVDRNTASSAENLAGSLKESHRAVLVGEKTYGKSGIQIPRLLPGGAIVLVVGAEHADLQGSVYTGVGIKPDVSVEGANVGDRTSEDPAVRKARELLKQRKPGS